MNILYPSINTVLISETSQSSITLEEVKTALAVIGTAQDLLIQGYINSAIGYVESYLNKALFTKYYKTIYDFQPLRSYRDVFISYYSQGYLKIPNAPLQEVTEVAYYGSDNVRTILDTQYYTFGIGNDSRLIFIEDEFYTRDFMSIEILHTSGYATMPNHIKQSVILYVQALYEGSGVCDCEMNEKVEKLLLRDRRINFS